MALAPPRRAALALRRRFFEAGIARIAVRPAPGVERLGSDYGGWDVPVGLIGEDWVVWSVGAGHDVSFDVEVLRRTGARVRSFDIMRRHLDDALAQADHHPRYSTHLAAIAPADGPLELFGSPDQATGGAAALSDDPGARWFELPGRSVGSLAAELGDARIDLLKLDVEGGEYALLDTLDLDALGVRMLGVELHATVSPRAARRVVEGVRARGFEVVSRHGTDLVLVRRDLLA